MKRLARTPFQMLFAFCAALVFSAAGVVADGARFPALYDVTGVAENDVLNLRQAPNSKAAILGTVPPDRKNLQVLELSDDGSWAHISMSETTGWANLHYLKAQPERPAGRLPAPLRCFGTEPFWGLHIPTSDFAEFEQLPEPERPFDVTFQGGPVGGATSDVGAILQDSDGQASLVLRREMCSDGMSDSGYGISIRLLIAGPADPAMYAGCCSLTGN